MVWGANPATDSPPLVHRQILRARARGAEVVVIDPQRTETARAAEAEWIPIRPGTDGALALGMLQVLIEEELYDESLRTAIGRSDSTSWPSSASTTVPRSSSASPAFRPRRSRAWRGASLRHAAPAR